MSNKKSFKVNGIPFKSLGNKPIDRMFGVECQTVDYAVPSPVTETYTFRCLMTGDVAMPDKDTIQTGESVLVDIKYQYSYNRNFNVSGSTASYEKVETRAGADETYRVYDPVGYMSSGEKVYDVLLYASSQQYECLVDDDEITLADGTKKKVQDVTYDDLVLTYNQYLGKFIGEYPCIITETPDFCINNIKRISFSDGSYLDIAGQHEILFDNNGTLSFEAVVALDEDDSIIGRRVACYDGSGGFTAKTVSSYQTWSEVPNSERVAYNVFVPIHGSVVANDVVCGGSFIVSEGARSIMSEDIERFDCGIVERAAETLTDAAKLAEYQQFNSSLPNEDLPIEVYMSSALMYLPRMPSHVAPTERDIAGLEHALYTWSLSLKPFPLVCKVKIEDGVYEVPKGGEFTFPAGHAKYFNTADYKEYLPSSKAKVWCNTVMVPIDE